MTHTVESLMALAYKVRDARTYEWDVSDVVAANEALRAALAEALSQPSTIGTKTWMEGGVMMTQNLTASDIYEPAQAAQPVREPLTEAQIDEAYCVSQHQYVRQQDHKRIIAFARAVERAHGIGGGE